MDRLPRDIQSVSAAQLEQAYRLDPVQFRSWFDTVYQQNPQSQLLQAWQARLGFDKTAQNPYTQNKALGDASRSNNSLIAKLPDFIATDAQWFYPRFIPFLVISALVIYFSISRALEKVYLLLSIGGLTLVLLVLL